MMRSKWHKDCSYNLKRNVLLQMRKREKMKDLKAPPVKTTLGQLIAVLCDETWPLLKNDRDVSIVVGYILNDLMLRNRGSRIRVGIDHVSCDRKAKNRGDNYENCLSRKGIDS